jgi:uncharacterized protein YraI
MRYAFIAAALVAFAAIAAQPASAGWHPVDARAAATSNVRSGPAGQYGIIGKIRKGDHVNVVGCLKNWDWCDVESRGKRGWMPAKYLQSEYRTMSNRKGRDVSVATFGPRLEIKEVKFDQRKYWTSYYSNETFYKKRYGTQNAGRDMYWDDVDRDGNTRSMDGYRGHTWSKSSDARYHPENEKN